jgi:FHIPEP family
MPADPRLAVPIEVQLDPRLLALAGTGGAAAVEAHLAALVTNLLVDLGLPGRPDVSVREEAVTRGIGVRVRGTTRLFELGLARGVWLEVLGPEEAFPEMPVGPFPGSRPMPGQWAGILVDALTPAAEARGPVAVRDFLTALAVEILRQRPGALVGPAYVEAQFAALARVIPRPPWFDPPAILTILHRLLDLGISLTHGDALQDVLGASDAAHCSPEDAAESAFSRLRPRVVELHAYPEILTRLVPDHRWDGPVQVPSGRLKGADEQRIQGIGDRVFEALGIPLPAVVLTPSDVLPPWTVAIKVNHYLARAATLPSVPADANAVAVALGDVFYREITRQADRLLGVEEVLVQLETLTQEFPRLVEATLYACSLQELTRVLRGLVAEGVTIRNLRAVLERVLEADAACLPRNAPRFTDDALGPGPRWLDLLAFVRTGLAAQISAQVAVLSGWAPVMVDRRIEARAEDMARRAGGRGLTEADAETLRDAVWEQVDALAPRPAVVVTTTPARRVLRELLAPELPHVPVIAREEFSGTLDPAPAATLRT